MGRNSVNLKGLAGAVIGLLFGFAMAAMAEPGVVSAQPAVAASAGAPLGVS
jgi:hypothetical protein